MMEEGGVAMLSILEAWSSSRPTPAKAFSICDAKLGQLFSPAGRTIVTNQKASSEYNEPIFHQSEKHLQKLDFTMRMTGRFVSGAVRLRQAEAIDTGLGDWICQSRAHVWG